MDFLKMAIFALMGGYATFLANRTIAVYHDGLRPMMPEFINGNISHREMLGISFAISIGFITGFAMPITLATGIIVVHIILLTADIIGVSVRNTIVAVALGALWGGAVPVLLDSIIALFGMLPVNFLDALAAVGDPITYAFVAFPALAVAYQFDKVKGLITFGVSLLGRIVVEFVNPVMIAGNEVSLSAEGIAMLCGMICLIVFAALDKSRGDDSGNNLFADNVKRIRGNIKWLIPMGAIISVAASYQWIAGEPIAAALLGKGDVTSAAIVAFIQAIAFLPLVITTALVSGVYATNGWCDWLEGLGYISPNPVVAAVLGGAAMGVEVPVVAFELSSYEDHTCWIVAPDGFRLPADSTGNGITTFIYGEKPGEGIGGLFEGSNSTLAIAAAAVAAVVVVSVVAVLLHRRTA